ncbi:DUF4139 domain-containing protein [Pontixanthobacter luteolus]|uniref:DUF4139 domain-containing protein n=1 Tax=Pontixanthobacter luteolus TaxID=295089 RepID=UPI0023023934|nr:hypothetical protein [Pontixanthobacter luteolus]
MARTLSFLASSFLALLGALALVVASPAGARQIVEASEPSDISVTMYRDPDRGADEAMDGDWPEGFAMISEVRTVTLPQGQSTIRFEGVAEGMVAVTAIVTGLAGGTIEKNRNADLLSPAALLDGTLGNRVRITRTNPATGISASQSAIVRTRADGGLVLQTGDGFEAVRCSGLPEKLTFDKVPAGLSARPVFSIDTRDDTGGTYQVTLTYLAWGFDWEAHYVATLDRSGAKGAVGLRLLSWLTLLNDNGQSFNDANLMAVAGTLNVESDFQSLSDPPQARPMRLTCYPLGSTGDGTPIRQMIPSPPPPPAPPMYASDTIVVTGSRVQRKMMESPLALAAIGMQAGEEQLGDLKLYRVPERVSVSAKGLKQVAFLNKDKVRGEFFYRTGCAPFDYFDDELEPAELMFFTKNDDEHGLGVAMPMGGFTLFEPSSAGDLLVNEQTIRDYAKGQEIELTLAQSTNVFAECSATTRGDPDTGKWHNMKAKISNANSEPVRLRLVLGAAGQWETRRTPAKVRIKDGAQIMEVRVPAGKTREFSWQIRAPGA